MYPNIHACICDSIQAVVTYHYFPPFPLSWFRNGHLCVWESSIEPSDLEPWEPVLKKKKETVDSDSEDDIPETSAEKSAKNSKGSKSDEEMDVDENGKVQFYQINNSGRQKC